MQKTLTYGDGRKVELSIRDGQLVEAASAGSGRGAIAEVSPATQEALSQPRSFPPLSSCLVPGDRVAIAVAAETPDLVAVVSGALAAFIAAGVEPRMITVVTAEKSDQHLLADSVKAAGCQIASHDPEDQTQLCFAGATHAGEPLMINRHVFEAEMVLPVSPTLPTSTEKPASLFLGLFPSFSDSPTRTRLSGAASLTPAACKEIDEAGWMLGIILVAQIARGEGGQVAEVIVGPPDEVKPAIHAAGQSGLSSYPQRTSLVVATLTGPAQEQTWQNIGLALKQAGRLAQQEGAIVLCTELTEPLNEEITSLIAHGEAEEWLNQVQELSNDESPPKETKLIRELSRAIRRGPVYLMSGIDPDWVEELGLAPVASTEELNRLVSRHDSVALIEAAQQAAVQLETVRLASDSQENSDGLPANSFGTSNVGK